MSIDSTILDSQISGVQQYSTQDPTAAGSPGVIVPPAVLQMLMKTSAALQPKPSAAPPHPQITALTSAIAGGLQVSFQQLTSPTPYGNQVVSYRIYRNTSANTFSGAQLIKTVPHDNSANQKTVQIQDLLGSNKTASYFVTAVDSTGQESTLPGSFQSASVNSGTFNPNISSPTPTTNSPSTTSGTYSVIAEMTTGSINFKGGKVLCVFTSSFTDSSTTNPSRGGLAIFRDGVQLTPDYFLDLQPTGGVTGTPDTIASVSFIDAPSAGSHTYDVRFKVAAGTGGITAVNLARGFQVVELG